MATPDIQVIVMIRCQGVLLRYKKVIIKENMDGGLESVGRQVCRMVKDGIEVAAVSHV